MADQEVTRLESVTSKEKDLYEAANSASASTYEDDDTHMRGPAPTEEEVHTLRKVSDKLPWSMWLVAVVELCERFTYYGISGPFQNYMQKKRTDHSNGPGGLGLGQQTSTALSYFFQFWCYVTPIPAAIIADSYTGKYKAICIFAGIYVVGNFVLFITSLPFSLEHNGGLGGLAAAMVIIGLGTGGIKSNVSPMIADQYTNTKQYTKVLKSGEKVLVDPALTLQTIFLVFYFCINFGSLSNIATTELEHYVDFWAAFLLPFCFFFVGIIALILGRNVYIKRPPQGTVIPNAFRIVVIAAKNGFKMEAAKPSLRRQQGLGEVGWSDLFVDEVTRALYACKLFVFYPIFWLVYGQMNNNFISQAGVMDTGALPNDVMQSINSIAIMIFIPIVNKLLYPALRRMGIPMRPITRIFWGFIMAALAMAYAAITQHLIYQAGPCYDAPMACPAGEISPGNYRPNDISVAVQAPAYVFVSFAEIFASVTGLEYAYTKAPANMKSLVMSLFLVTNAIGSALGIALSSVSKDPKLQWMYVGLCGATVVAACLFWILFRSYNAREEEWNKIDADYTAELNAQLEKDKHHAHADVKEA